MPLIQVGFDKLEDGASVVCTTKTVLHDFMDCTLVIASGILVTDFPTGSSFSSTRVLFPVPHMRVASGGTLHPFVFDLRPPGADRSAFLEATASVALSLAHPAEDEDSSFEIDRVEVSARKIHFGGSINRDIEIACLDLNLGALNTFVQKITYDVSMLLLGQQIPSVAVDGITGSDYREV